nr:immunoglobulin light chain junction region [Macaca mulatta]MOV94440.1 immunoglobulin light chain junction region [Macaca mulatta]MOV95112.1 immunoglobulin light chain junction region [Macaca mulatta]MOV95157.1 immunoglobulin light chain junction region [Macaca mulatta]MOV95338.1 immunoglobulin light chain junction region [Macaca mulatta]
DYYCCSYTTISTFLF